MITREFPPVGGGIGYYVQNLSKTLTQKGHRVSVITRGSPHRVEKRSIDGIDVYEATFFPFYPIHLELHRLFVNQLLRSLKPDLVHLHSPVTPTINVQCPIVTTVHTAMKTDARYHEVVNANSLAEKIQSMYFSPFAESQLLKQSNVITAVSPTISQELVEYGINPKEVKVVWNGVDEKRFSPSKSALPQEKYILFTGRLWARKGLFDLIESAQILKSSIPNIKFVICGTGPLLQKLKEQVHNASLDNNIQFLGRVSREKLLTTYQNATMQIVPSIYEGLPTVILEGMSCGLPIIATDIGGSRDIIENGKSGLLVPPVSPKDLASAIAKLWTNDELRNQLGKNARETILKRFTWDKITNTFLGLYNQAIMQAIDKPVTTNQ
jgi:alpha-maltose-1-phosphate synthase